MINTVELIDKLDKAGVNPAHYSIGKIKDNAYIIRSRDSQWEIFFFERGMSYSLKLFNNESDACDYAFKQLTGPTSVVGIKKIQDVGEQT